MGSTIPAIMPSNPPVSGAERATGGRVAFRVRVTILGEKPV